MYEHNLHDEIGDMPLPLQAKLLRAIESRTIQRVGGAEDIKIDLRLVCATHRDLEKKVESGEFRADLFFRINVLPINVPSLAERREDIPNLQQTLLKKMNVEINYNSKILKISEQKLFTQNNTIEAGYIFNCAGLFADEIAKKSNLEFRYSFLPFKGKYWKITEKIFSEEMLSP